MLGDSLAVAEIDETAFAFNEDDGRVTAEDRCFISRCATMRFATTNDFFKADYGPDCVFGVPVVDLFLQLCRGRAFRCWHFWYLR
ncbi:MAG: hypothetical protein JWP42_4329 [Pseudomonas sp.]|nr:hypothetical protein [Pseudomonas sp.]